MRKDPGGPAFPLHPDLPGKLGCGHADSDAGMTMRDYFAAKAMCGYMACPDTDGNPDAVAKYAYDIADAMLRARAR